MKKKILVLLLCISIFALAGCSKDSDSSGKESKRTESKEEEVAGSGFEASEDVIMAYWEAFADCSKKGIKKCFPDKSISKRDGFSVNIDENVDASYELAEKVKDSVDIRIKDIKIERDVYDVDELDSELTKAFEIDKAYKSTVTVPMKRESEGKEYEIEDIYEMLTIRIEGNWYLLTMKETDVRVVDGE